MGKFKLIYFNLRGRGEISRMLFSAANVEFDDERIEFADWPALKATIPSGQVPLLYTPEGKCLSQSMAIARYLAKKFDFYTNDTEAMYRIEYTLSLYQDCYEGSAKVRYGDPAKKEELRKAYTEVQLPTILKQVAAHLAEVPAGQFIAGGSKPTIADILMVTMDDSLKADYDEQLAKFPQIRSHIDRVLGALPGIVEYMKKRPTSLY